MSWKNKNKNQPLSDKELEVIVNNWSMWSDSEDGFDNDDDDNDPNFESEDSEKSDNEIDDNKAEEVDNVYANSVDHIIDQVARGQMSTKLKVKKMLMK